MRVGTHTLVAKNPRLSQGVFALFWLVSGCLAAVAAARIALAHADGGHETSRFLQFLALGYSIDLQFVFPVLAFATVGGVTARQGLWLAGFLRHSVWVRLLPELTLLMACILLWALSITVTEFRIQRGVFPTFFDFQNGLESNFITSSLPTFFLKRYQTGNTLFLLWLVAFGLSVGLRMRQSALSSAGETALGNRLLWIALGTFVPIRLAFACTTLPKPSFPPYCGGPSTMPRGRLCSTHRNRPLTILGLECARSFAALSPHRNRLPRVLGRSGSGTNPRPATGQLPAASTPLRLRLKCRVPQARRRHQHLHHHGRCKMN